MKHLIVKQKSINENEISLNELKDVADGSVDLLELEDILDYIEKRHDLLRTSIKKLRHSGIIEIRGTDILELARYLFTARINFSDANKLMYCGKQSMDSIISVVNMLKNLELNILTKQLYDCRYYVRAQRP